ncbi:MAG: T9SS type A sorting domain-containing protein, partial [Flavobacteriales bacterium]|nr:T9SS type A sorting domain-containing protein [Flavobacteriales bacterium]
VNWVEMSYQFVADEAYQFVAFGNFYDDSLTDTLRIGGEPSGEVTGYYYLDDFCLTTSPDGCDFTNTTKFEDKTEVLVYPVPCQDHLVVEQTTPIEQIEIYNTQGELLTSHYGDKRNKTRLNIELPSGMYILVIYSDEQKQVKRFVVSN